MLVVVLLVEFVIEGDLCMKDATCQQQCQVDHLVTSHHLVWTVWLPGKLSLGCLDALPDPQSHG